MIVVFGSIGLDIVQSVRRLPRPGETVLTGDYVMLPGGKGANQALAAARAGGDVRFIASIGQDDFGTRALANLDSEGIDLTGVARHERPTACATISVDESGENQIVVSSGANLETTAGQLQAGSGDIVLQQLEIPGPEIWAAIDRAADIGARNILNAAPYQTIPPESLGKLEYLIVNEVEASMLADDLSLDSHEPEQICAHVRDQFGITTVLTLGAQGAMMSGPDVALKANALPIQAKDTVGAGDAFVGAFTAALDGGKGPADCLAWGCVSGSLACLNPGAQDGVPAFKDIEGRLGEIQVTAIS